jgi:hypothetical protein
MKIGLPCDFVASNSLIIGPANSAACGAPLQRPLSGGQFRSAACPELAGRVAEHS